MSNAVEQFAVLKFQWFLANARLQPDVVGQWRPKARGTASEWIPFERFHKIRAIPCS